MPSYYVTIYRTNGGKQTGHRFTELKNIEDVQLAVAERLRNGPAFDTVAYISVVPTDIPATKPLLDERM